MKKLLLLIALVPVALAAWAWWALEAVTFQVATERKVVALSFDDGPNPPDTQALLELLSQEKVRATFFPIGRNVEAYPDALRQVHSDGHEIGNHSYSHNRMWSFSTGNSQEEVSRTNDIIESVTGSVPLYFRPPYLSQGWGLKSALAQLGMLSIAANLSGADWEVFDPQEIARPILDNVQPGSIVLLHDGDGDAADAASQTSRAGSVTATRIIIESLRSQGYEFVTVGELMSLQTP